MTSYMEAPDSAGGLLLPEPFHLLEVQPVLPHHPRVQGRPLLSPLHMPLLMLLVVLLPPGVQFNRPLEYWVQNWGQNSHKFWGKLNTRELQVETNSKYMIWDKFRDDVSKLSIELHS